MVGSYGVEFIMFDYYFINVLLFLVVGEVFEYEIVDWYICVIVNGISFIID